jgi:hypothetical protein
MSGAVGQAAGMGLDVATHMLVTKELKGRYDRGSKSERTAVLDELCGLTGWHRDHARRALRTAPGPGQERRTESRGLRC